MMEGCLGYPGRVEGILNG
ncbi:hypothetical protein A2U01_0086630, partial [Trifolium medium]|nr:hypothetical protein [Trifolium medium]